MSRYLALSIIVAALSTIIAFPALPTSRAQGVGTVCIADISSTSCPSAPPSFTGPLDKEPQFAVNIQNSDSFNAYDISVKTNAGILNPFSVDLTGSLIHDPRTIVSECVNNQPVIGSCRSGIDDYGVVSLAVTALGYNVEAPASGRLFSITYNTGDFVGVLGDSSPIEFQTGCANTSNDGSCVTIADGTTRTTVPETLQGATFTFRDFSLGVSPDFQTIKKGSSPAFTVTLTSVGDYSATVRLSTSIAPITTHAPARSLDPTTVTLSPGSTSTSTLTVTTTRSTTVGRYAITITGTDGVLIRSVSLTLLVENR